MPQSAESVIALNLPRIMVALLPFEISSISLKCPQNHDFHLYARKLELAFKNVNEIVTVKKKPTVRQ